MCELHSDDGSFNCYPSENRSPIIKWNIKFALQNSARCGAYEYKEKSISVIPNCVELMDSNISIANDNRQMLTISMAPERKKPVANSIFLLARKNLLRRLAFTRTVVHVNWNYLKRMEKIKPLINMQWRWVWEKKTEKSRKSIGPYKSPTSRSKMGKIDRFVALERGIE